MQIFWNVWKVILFDDLAEDNSAIYSKWLKKRFRNSYKIRLWAGCNLVRKKGAAWTGEALHSWASCVYLYGGRARLRMSIAIGSQYSYATSHLNLHFCNTQKNLIIWIRLFFSLRRGGDQPWLSSPAGDNIVEK